MEKPLYKHTCPTCTFLGTYKQKDLYHCLQGGAVPTLIARNSSTDYDYASGIAFKDTNEYIGEAYKLATWAGLKLSM